VIVKLGTEFPLASLAVRITAGVVAIDVPAGVAVPSPSAAPAFDAIT
jgi:hypothetical protein